MIKRNKQTDFFFGEISVDKQNVSLSLHDVLDCSAFCDSTFFTSQLNRCLKESQSRYLVLHDESSLPDFEQLLTKVLPQSIGWMEIIRHKDVNPNVGITLACKIYLENGIVELRPHWCAYKDIRTEEIISTLVKPLKEKDLLSKTFLRWGENEVEQLNGYLAEPSSLVKAVVSFAGSGMSLSDNAFSKKLIGILE